MIKIRSMAQAMALAQVVDTEAGGNLDVAQSRSLITVSRLNESGKVEVFTHISLDGKITTSGEVSN